MQTPTFRIPQIDTLDQHLAAPDITPPQYWKARHHSQALEILGKTRIYLDQKYWIYCRDVVRQKPQKPIHLAIWKKLVDLVASGRVVCPAGQAVFLETNKQREPEAVKLMGEVVDSLTCRTIVRDFRTRHQIEVLHVVRRLLDPQARLVPLAENMWSFAGLVLGAEIPHHPDIDPMLDRAMQKAWLDVLIDYKFSDMLAMLQGANFDLDDTQRMSRLTEEARRHRGDFKTFAEALDLELRGALDGFVPDLDGAYEYLARESSIADLPRLPEAMKGIAGPLLRNAIYLAVKAEKIRWTDFPSVHIGATIHAELRFSDRALKKGDSFDWRHAEEALPYCNYFFTERSLCALLTSSRVQLDKAYGCKVLSAEEDVLQALEGLAAPAPSASA